MPRQRLRTLRFNFNRNAPISFYVKKNMAVLQYTKYQLMFIEIINKFIKFKRKIKISKIYCSMFYMGPSFHLYCCIYLVIKEKIIYWLIDFVSC